MSLEKVQEKGCCEQLKIWIHENPTTAKVIEVAMVVLGSAMIAGAAFATSAAIVAGLAVGGALLLVIGAVALCILDMAVPPHHEMSNHVFEEAKCEGGRLYYEGDVPILSLDMEDPFEAGKAHGYLCGSAIYEIVSRFGLFQPSVEQSQEALKQLREVIPEKYLKEMEGLMEGYNRWVDEQPIWSRAAKLTLDQVLLFHLIPDKQHLDPTEMRAPEQEVFPMAACSSIVEGGEFARNMDWPSLGVAGTYTLVVHRKNKEGHSTVDITPPGFIGVLTGMNSANLSLSMNVCPGDTQEMRGMPAALYNRYCLENCATVEEVKKLSRRPLGPYHLTVVDPSESAAIHFYQGEQDTDVIRQEEQLYSFNNRHNSLQNIFYSRERREEIVQFFANRKERPLEDAQTLPYINNWLTTHRVVMNPSKGTMRVAFDNAFAGKAPLHEVPINTLMGATTVCEPSLESQFFEQAFCEVDIEADCGFQDFLSPNEWNPEGIEAHLKRAEKGIHVGCGTFRMFAHIAFSDKEKCEGIVIRDINPRVKGHNDFTIMALRVADTLEEFVRITTPLKNDLKDRVEELRVKIQKAPLPNEEIRNYYLNNIEKLAKVYLKEASSDYGIEWRENALKEHFVKARYDLDETLFAKVQKYAREGKIISTIGEINDLKFLRNKKISVVDTSNICQYSQIDLQGEGDFRPLVIRAIGTGRYPTVYKSYKHNPLTTDQRDEYTAIINKLKKCRGFSSNISTAISNHFSLLHLQKDEFDDPGSAVCPKTVELLKEFERNSILHIPNVGFIDCSSVFDVSKFNQASEAQVKELHTNGALEPVLNSLLNNWFMLNPSHFFALAISPGWSDAVQEQFTLAQNKPMGTSTDLPHFKKYLQEANLFETFLDTFGRERFATLESNYHALKRN